jgi:TetR/AcrR family acrAB operon transcriptional repressor
MREKLLTALRKAAAQSSPRLPDAEEVAAVAQVSVTDVREHLGSPDNFAALLFYQAPAHETRERILASAARVFGLKGFQRASLDAVAADAGMTKGAIYWHFKSKNDLFFALLDQRFRQHTNPLMVDLDVFLRSGQEPLQGMTALFRDGMRRCTDDPEWAHLYLECLSLGRNADVRERLADFYDRVWEISANLTRELQAHDLAPGHIDPKVAAIFWTALFDGLVVAWLIKGDALNLDEVLPDLFKMLWHGLAPDGRSKKTNKKYSSAGE